MLGKDSAQATQGHRTLEGMCREPLRGGCGAVGAHAASRLIPCRVVEKARENKDAEVQEQVQKDRIPDFVPFGGC